MSDNDLCNPDGSRRRIVHPPPPPPLPPPNNQLPPFNFLRSPQPYGYNTPVVPVPIRRIGNNVRMPQVGYHNVIMQQSIQQHFLMDTWVPRGPHEIKSSIPVQTTSVPQPSPQPTPPPLVLTPQPVPLPLPPTENLGKMVPASIQNEQEERQANTAETGETSAYELDVNALQRYSDFGGVIGFMFESLKNTKDELERCHKTNNELRAQKQVQTEQIQELQEKVTFLNNNMQEIKEKLAKEVEQDRREKNAWKDSCVKLNEKIIEVKKDLESTKEKNSKNVIKIAQLEADAVNVELAEREKRKLFEARGNEIDLLRKKVREKEKKISILELSEKKTNERLHLQEKNIQQLKEKCNKKGEQILKLQENFDKIKSKNKQLEITIGDYVKKDKASNAALKNLVTERNNLKSRVEELAAKMSERINEISSLSGELEKERNKNQAKKLELEKKSKKITELKKELKLAAKEHVEFPKKFIEHMKKFPESDSQNWCKREVLTLPSSSDEETEESLSMSVAENDDNKNDINGIGNQEDEPEYQVAAHGENRKYPTSQCSPEKKARGDDAYSSIDTDQPHHRLIRNQSHTTVVHLPRNYQRSTGRGDAELPEMSSSSRASNIPSSSGMQQRGRSDSTHTQ